MRAAVAQIDPKLAEVGRNLETCVAQLEQAANEGAQLLVLPECAIPGYMFDSAEEAMPFAEEIPGPSSEVLERECARLGMHVVCGMLERDGDALRYRVACSRQAKHLLGGDALGLRSRHAPHSLFRLRIFDR